MKIVVVASPFPSGGGGSYRALKSILAYPDRGIELSLVIPYGGLQHRDDEVLNKLRLKGVKVLGYSRSRIPSRIISTYLNLLIPEVSVKIDLRRLSDVDLVLSFHETYDALYTARKIALKFNAKSVAVLQLPPFYTFRERVENLQKAFELWFDNAYGITTKWLHQLYRSSLIG